MTLVKLVEVKALLNKVLQVLGATLDGHVVRSGTALGIFAIQVGASLDELLDHLKVRIVLSVHPEIHRMVKRGQVLLQRVGGEGVGELELRASWG